MTDPMCRAAAPVSLLVSFLASLLLLLPAVARAQDQRGNWSLTLGATGTSNQDFDQHAVGARAGLGYFFTDALELSLRQTISYASVPDSTSLDAATIVALDWHFRLGPDHRWVPYIGGNAGYFYGDSVSDQFEAGPEVGLKYFVNATTFIDAHAEYQFFFSGTGGGSSDDQQLVYTLGLGFRF